MLRNRVKIIYNVVRTQIIWMKDKKEIRKSRKYKISRKGALKIIDIASSDGGIYACIGKQFVSLSHFMLHIDFDNNNRPSRYIMIIFFFFSGKFTCRDASDSKNSHQRANK